MNRLDARSFSNLCYYFHELCFPFLINVFVMSLSVISDIFYRQLFLIKKCRLDICFYLFFGVCVRLVYLQNRISFDEEDDLVQLQNLLKLFAVSLRLETHDVVSLSVTS